MTPLHRRPLTGRTLALTIIGKAPRRMRPTGRALDPADVVPDYERVPPLEVIREVAGCDSAERVVESSRSLAYSGVYQLRPE